MEALVASGRAAAVTTEAGEFWCATERGPLFDALSSSQPEEAASIAVRGHLDVVGPVTAAGLAQPTGLSLTTIVVALAGLENEGFVLRGTFDPGLDGEQFCARRLLARIHSYTQKRLRREIEPVTAQDFMRFLLRWQHVAPGTQREGRAGLAKVIEQLQGFEVPAGAWEERVLAARVTAFRTEWLDDLCHSGMVAWARLGLREDETDEPRTGITSRATPVSLTIRADLDWLLQAARGTARPLVPTEGPPGALLKVLRERGALFHGELVTATGCLPTDIEDALWDSVARGLITADGFAAIRSLLSARDRWDRRQHAPRRGLRRGVGARAGNEGRWSLLPQAAPVDDIDGLAEAVAEQLLARWGVVFRAMLVRETLAIPWREVLFALRRMEARGTARGGRFVTGFTGEQYALPEAVDALRAVRKRERDGEVVRLSGADPLNLISVITAGPRVAAIRTNTVEYIDGIPTLPPENAALLAHSE